MPAVAMIIWLGVTPTQLQTVQMNDAVVHRQQNVLRQAQQAPPVPCEQSKNALKTCER